MLLSFLPRLTKVVEINSTSNNVNLFSRASAPSYPLTIICQINSNISSNAVNTVAFETGTGWAPGTLLYIKNNATIRGAPATKPSAPGMPGRGGDGGNGYDYSYGSATAGSSGSQGANGSTGSTGGPALRINDNINVITILNNQSGQIRGGTGSPGGPAGPGGGGGGGGSGSNYKVQFK